MIPLTNHDFQWGRSEVVIFYPKILCIIHNPVYMMYISLYIIIWCISAQHLRNDRIMSNSPNSMIWYATSTDDDHPKSEKKSHASSGSLVFILDQTPPKHPRCFFTGITLFQSVRQLFQGGNPKIIKSWWCVTEKKHGLEVGTQSKGTSICSSGAERLAQHSCVMLRPSSRLSFAF